MSRSKYINTFNTTAEYDAYIESAYPEFPNVGYDKQTGNVNVRRQSPNNYQIWGTTTATSNFNIKLNGTNVEVTVDPLTGEFYLTGWTGTLTSLSSGFSGLSHITSIKKFALDTSSVTSLYSTFGACTSLTTLDLSTCDFSNVTSQTSCFYNAPSLKDVYITEEATLRKLTNNLASQNTQYIPSTATIHYNGTDYKWQNNAWTPQNV